MSFASSIHTRGSGLTIAVAAVSVLAAAAWWHGRNSRRDRRRQASNGKGTTPLPPPAEVSPAVEHTFLECAERIRNVTSLSDGDKLFLYALYKQATMGDAPSQFNIGSMSNSSWNVVAAQAKYLSWRKIRGMPRSAAYFQYIATAQIHIEQQDDLYEMEDQTDCADNRTTPTTTTTKQQQGHSSFGGMTVSVSRYAGSTSEDWLAGKDDNDGDIHAALLRASAANHVAKVRQLVTSQGSQLDLNHKDAVGQTALHMAADHGSIGVIALLLDLNRTKSNGGDATTAVVDVNAVDEDGISVLQAAVIAGQVEACRLLLRHGANPDLPDDDGDTPRHCAADDGSPDMQRLFAETPMVTSATMNGSSNGH